MVTHGLRFDARNLSFTRHTSPRRRGDRSLRQRRTYSAITSRSVRRLISGFLRVCGWLLSGIQQSVALAHAGSAGRFEGHKHCIIMDEVDVLLHPLRSELNFPIGEKVPVDLSGDRWELPLFPAPNFVAVVLSNSVIIGVCVPA